MKKAFQRINFQKQFPQQNLEYDEVKQEYKNSMTQILFDGWCKAVEESKEKNGEFSS